MSRRRVVIAGLSGLLLVGFGLGPLARTAVIPGAVVGAALPCDQFPTPPPVADAPMPLATQVLADSHRTSAPRVTTVFAWASCFRPQMVTIRAGEIVQWQAVGAPAEPEVVLDDGTVIGPVRMVLEVRFNRPEHYSYHARSNPAATGTVIVQGTESVGPVLDIQGPPGKTRQVWQLP